MTDAAELSRRLRQALPMLDPTAEQRERVRAALVARLGAGAAEPTAAKTGAENTVTVTTVAGRAVAGRAGAGATRAAAVGAAAHAGALASAAALLGVGFALGYWFAEQPSPGEAPGSPPVHEVEPIRGTAPVTPPRAARPLTIESAPPAPPLELRPTSSEAAGPVVEGMVSRGAAHDPPVLAKRASGGAASAEAESRAVSPRNTPERARATRSAQALGEELNLLQRAERAIRARDGVLARSFIDELQTRFPETRLREERAAVLVLAACVLGEPRALADAERFLTQYPGSVYFDRVRALCNGTTTNAAPSPDADGSTSHGH